MKILFGRARGPRWMEVKRLGWDMERGLGVKTVSVKKGRVLGRS
jgi:hypothetical protein